MSNRLNFQNTFILFESLFYTFVFATTKIYIENYSIRIVHLRHWWAFTFKIFHYWECGLETSYFKLTNVETPFTICFAVLYILVLLNIFFIFEQHKRSALIWKLQYFVTKKITWDLRGGGNNMLCCVVYTTFN